MKHLLLAVAAVAVLGGCVRPQSGSQSDRESISIINQGGWVVRPQARPNSPTTYPANPRDMRDPGLALGGRRTEPNAATRNPSQRTNPTNTATGVTPP